MANGIGVDILANTKDFQRGIKDVEKGLTDVAGSLDDVARDGDKAGQNLEAGLKQAQQETGRTERSFKDLADTVKRETRTASKDIDEVKDSLIEAGRKGGRAFGDGIEQGAHTADRGMSRAGEAVRGFKDEARQNFAEVASSFDGTAQGIADGVQGTLGGLAIGIGGPIGLAAAGVGAISGAMLQNWIADTEKVKEEVQAMYDDLLASGQDYLTKEAVQQNIAEMFKDDGRVSELTDQAKLLGVAVSDVATAFATEGQKREEVSGRVQELIRQEQDKIVALGAISTEDEAARVDAANARIIALEGVAGKIDAEAGKLDKAKERVNATRDAWTEVDSEFSKQHNAALNGIETQGQRLQGYADQLKGLPNPKLKLSLDKSDIDDAERRMGALATRRYEISVGVHYPNGKPIIG